LNFHNVLKFFSFNDAGLWTSGKKMNSWEFTTVPEHYVFDEKLIIYEYHIFPDTILDEFIALPRK